MGLVMKGISTILIVFCLSLNVEASWEPTPKEVLSGAWGGGDEQFGIEYGDSHDRFASRFYILLDGGIIIRDIINGRRKIYNNNGELIKILKCVKNQSGLWNEECRISGKYIQTSMDGNIWIDLSRHKKQKITLHSPTGELLQTYKERPLELGRIISSDRQADGTYKTIIQYDDAAYNLRVSTSTSNFTQDQEGHVLAVVRESVGEEVVTSVYKYDRCGKELGQMDMPANNIIEAPDTIPPRPTPKLTIVAEYGQPVIGPDGSVYAWKRTEDAYSILKWSWVDEPTDPKGGPDAPVNVGAVLSANGINISWKASPHDPGCVSNYEIERSTTAGGGFSSLATVNKGVFKYEDTTASEGTTYYYRVRAVAVDLYSDYTAEVEVTR